MTKNSFGYLGVINMNNGTFDFNELKKISNKKSLLKFDNISPRDLIIKDMIKNNSIVLY